MKPELVMKTTRSAVLKLEGAGKYYAECKYELIVNGERAVETDRTVTTIRDLEPDTEYTVCASWRGERTKSVRFRTDREYVTLNVRNFGAYGDGIHDDTGAVQAAVTACPLQSRVLFPEGVYKVSCIFLKSDITLHLEKMCPGETTMGEESGRFGFCYETGKFAAALQTLRSIPNVRVAGLHLHSSSKSRSVGIFRSIARTACRLQQEFDLSLSYVDLGGGYCGGMEGRPEYPDYFPAVAEELSKCFTPDRTKLIVEPGISLISKCTTFVTSVFDTRDIKGTRYVMTDGSRFNIDATMIKTSHLFHVLHEKGDGSERASMPRQIISGYTCMECDRMFSYDNSPELFPGDRIVYENVGGYTMSLNPLFIQYFPAVYIKRNDSLIQVRRKWTPEDYIQGTTLTEDA